MRNGKHAIVSTTTTHAGWSKIIVATIRLPDGKTITREIEDHGATICVLPYNPQRRTAVLVRQFRAPVFHAVGQEDMLEAIAGILEEDDPAECARRETAEETGLELDSIEHVFTAWTMPGLSTERMHFFLATFSGGVAENRRYGVPGEHEDIVPVEIGLAALAAQVDAGQIADAKTLLLVQTARLRAPHLFSA
jgi:nudix-type nucleoside diphosphatase (YffH/AdpP family)